MPSSKLRRSPDKTFSAMGRRRWSVRMSSLKYSLVNGRVETRRYSSTFSDFPESGCRSPEQQKRNTNITVHGEKRSVQLAQIVRFDQGMFVGEERRDNHNSKPSGPGERKAGGK